MSQKKDVGLKFLAKYGNTHIWKVIITEATERKRSMKAIAMKRKKKLRKKNHGSSKTIENTLRLKAMKALKRVFCLIETGTVIKRLPVQHLLVHLCFAQVRVFIFFGIVVVYVWLNLKSVLFIADGSVRFSNDSRNDLLARTQLFYYWFRTHAIKINNNKWKDISLFYFGWNGNKTIEKKNDSRFKFSTYENTIFTWETIEVKCGAKTTHKFLAPFVLRFLYHFFFGCDHIQSRGWEQRIVKKEWTLFFAKHQQDVKWW